MKRIPILLCLVILAAGCSPGVSGSYKPAGGGAVFQSLTFKSGGKVELTFFGATVEGDYEVEDGKVKLTGPEGSRVLTIDGDCLDGGQGLAGLGRYCRS
jgi:hypothetical protein